LVLHQLGTQFSKGLTSFDSRTGQFQNYKQFPEDPQNKADCIRVVFEDSDGILWCGTQEGVFRFDRSSMSFDDFFKNVKGADNLQLGPVESIYEDILGNLWMSSSDGLFIFQKDKNFVSKRADLPPGPFYSDPLNQGQSFWATPGYVYIVNVLNKTYDQVYNNIIDPSQSTKVPFKATTGYLSKSGIYWFSLPGKGVSYINVNQNNFNHVYVDPDPFQPKFLNGITTFLKKCSLRQTHTPYTQNYYFFREVV